jgi:aspartate/methionine/tyrosine aminotransferase
VLALFGSRRRKARDVIDLTLSNPTQVGLHYPEQALQTALAPAGISNYVPDSQGLHVARSCIARDWYARGHEIAPEDIVLTASTSEAYSILFKLFCDPGNEVLIPEPSYPLFDVLTRLEGLVAKPYRLAYDGAWHIDFESLTAARTAQTRAIVMVSPNNPTGNFVTPCELAQVATLGLPLIADEVFWPYRLSGSPGSASSLLGTPGTLTCVLDGLSKRCGLPQLKLGWISLSGPEQLKAEARSRLELINDSYLSASTQVQLALPALLKLGQDLKLQLLERCSVNLETLKTSVRGSAVSLLHVGGGWSACLRMPNLLSDDEWALSLFDEHRLLTQPGWFYDLGPAPHLVVSLLIQPELFNQGIEKLVRHASSKLDS